MKLTLYVGYVSLLSLALFLLVTMGVAAGTDSRQIHHPVNACLKLKHTDPLGRHYFELHNLGDGAIYIDADISGRPVYSVQLRSPYGDWQFQENGICEIRARPVLLNPGQVEVFELNHVSPQSRIGVSVRTDFDPTSGHSYYHRHQAVWSDATSVGCRDAALSSGR